MTAILNFIAVIVIYLGLAAHVLLLAAAAWAMWDEDRVPPPPTKSVAD